MKKITSAVLTLLTLLSIESFAQSPVNQTIQLTTTIQKNKPSITFTWNTIAGAASFKVYRKLKTGVTWGSAIATLAANATGFIDSTISIGTGYEYKFYELGSDTATTYVYAGIEVPAIEARGKMVLLVDSTIIDSIPKELWQLQTSLIADGWTVIRKNVGRNDSTNAVKRIITNIYTADPTNVKSLFIFGHVPVPYSGDMNPDGHPDHLGAWPCDDYYADMDSNWTDQYINDVGAGRSQNWNVPGDGKLDQNDLNQMGSDMVELETGRVDLSNLPSFSKTEIQLLKQYIIKDHNYKYKIINPTRQALISDNFQSYNLEYFSSTGWRNFAALFNAGNITENDPGFFSSLTTQSYLFAYACGGGTYTSAGGVGSTSNFAADSVESIFSMMFGSYFGDWDSQDNFLRAPLASNGWTLTDCWAGRPYWNFHHMGLGETIGYDAKLSVNSNGSLYITNPTYPWLGQYANMGLMGDPSLRLHVVAPPANVASVGGVGGKINLSWTAAPATDSVLGYYIYSLDTITQVYNRISPTIVASLNFTDNSPYNGKNYYMVRSIRLEKSASGTYYNLSEGMFDTTFVDLTGIAPVVEQNIDMSVYPNPAKDNVIVKFYLGSNKQVKLTLINVLGEQVKEVENTELGAGQHTLNFNVANLAEGMYYLKLQADNSGDSFKKILVSGH